VISMIQREQYMNFIRPLINDPLIKVITGMRRVGKSTLLQLIREELIKSNVAPDQIIEMNFELFAFNEYKTAETMHSYIKSRIINDEMYYLFLDEIQEVEGFEKAINSLTLEHRVDIYITGSNSNLLSGELATYLTGRYIAIEVYPLSFKEIMSAKPNTDKNDEFIEYIKYGGLPSLLRFDDGELKKQYIDDMFSSILLKDIVQRFGIRDTNLLQRFIRYVFQNIAQVFSAQKITQYLKNEMRALSRETIYNYIEACKNAFLIYAVPRYDIKGKQLLRTREKFFINDLGIRGIEFDNESDIGQSLENIVFLELKRRDFKISTGELPAGEIDFVVEKGSSKAYIQVCYLLASPETVAREFTALEKIDDNYPKFVLSMDKIKIERNGIRHLNVIDFLLGDEITPK
jgi:predicted AAA+ superfamily ATPase